MINKKLISSFVKDKRKKLGLTQPELAQRAGVGLRFVRELEQGKSSFISVRSSIGSGKNRNESKR